MLKLLQTKLLTAQTSIVEDFGMVVLDDLACRGPKRAKKER